MTGRLVLTAAETAEVLGISTSAVVKMVRRGDLPRVDLGGMRVLRIPTAAVEELVARSVVSAEEQGRRLRLVANGPP